MMNRSKAVYASIICIGLAYLWSLFPHPVIVVPLVLLPLLLWGTLRFQFVIIIFFILFSFFRFHEVFPFLMPFKIPKLLALAALFVLGFKLVLSRDLHPFWTRELNLLTAFFILIVIGTMFSQNRGLAMEALLGVFIKVYLMTLVICWQMRKETDFSLALSMITNAGLIVAIVALYNKMNGIGLVEGTRVTIGRDIGSILGDPNDLSLVLLFPLSFALSRASQSVGNTYGRLWAMFISLILISAIIATQSRGGLLGLMSVSAFLFYQKVPNKTVMAAMSVIAILVLFFAAGISDRSSGGAAEEGIDESAMGRLYAWEAAFYMALDNPLFGVGIDNFYHNYYLYSQFWDGKNHAVHSTWFGVLGESGFIGFFVFLALVIFTILTARTNLIRSKQLTSSPVIHSVASASLAGLLGFCASGTFLTMGFNWPLYLQIAVTVSLAKFIESNSKSQCHSQNAHSLNNQGVQITGKTSIPLF